MSKKVVIVGGGVAGLSAGIYSAMNGFETEIIEMHTVAGGQCTAWDRKGYRFDYCLHWLVGTSQGAFNEIWKETNVINDDTEIIDHEIHSRILDDQGNEFIIYSNIDQWEKYLIELAPEDKSSIKKMCTDMRKSALMEPFETAPELRNPLDNIKMLPKMLPLLNVIRKYGRMTCGEYFEKLNFKSDKIKNIFFTMYGDSDFSALFFIFMLGWYHQKNAGYIKGGSYPMAHRMVEKFEKLGGKMSYKKKVEKIIVENNVAKGVFLSILGDILKGYKNWKLFTPIVQVSFGINKSIPCETSNVSHICNDKWIGKTKLDKGYSIMNYWFDTTMAPEGKTSIALRFESPWELWEMMDEAAYQAEKLQITKDATALLEKEYPGILEFIEVTDVATPKTDVKYTGVKDGAYEGFFPSKENLMKSLKMQLPKLRNFYMAGQWLYPGGGLPPSAQSGKWVIQLICKKEKQKFVADK